MRSNLTLFILLFFVVNIIAAQEKFSRERLIADVDTLYAAIEEIHPGMFAVYPRDKFEKDITEVKSNLKDSMTVIDFFQLVTPLVVRLGDGHTRISFPTQVLKDRDALVFPFSVKINKKDYSVTVDTDFSENKTNLISGTQLLSINDKNVKDLVNDFLRFESGEKLNFRLGGVQYSFAYYLNMIYGDKDFAIEYIDNTNIVRKETIKPIPYSVRFAKPANNNNQANVHYTLAMDSLINTAIIDFKSFSDFSRFEKFLDSAFTQIKKENIGNLIIDLRRNGGGNSALGDELFQYISPVPFMQYGNVTVKTSDRLKRKMSGYDGANGLATYKNDSLIPLRKNDLRYKGKTYLLTSDYTFSSATDFAWAFQYFKMGTIVGEETGGLIVCFGDVIGQKLPNTGLVFGVSWKKFYGYGATDEHTHGVKPDYEVPAEQAMDFVKALINKSE